MFVTFGLDDGVDFILSLQKTAVYPDGEIMGGIDVFLPDLFGCGIVGDEKLLDREIREIKDFFTQMFAEENTWYKIMRGAETEHTKDSISCPKGAVCT